MQQASRCHPGLFKPRFVPGHKCHLDSVSVLSFWWIQSCICEQMVPSEYQYTGMRERDMHCDSGCSCDIDACVGVGAGV